MYIGIDIHKDSCYITALNESGKILWKKEVKTEDGKWIGELGKRAE